MKNKCLLYLAGLLFTYSFFSYAIGKEGNFFSLEAGSSPTELIKDEFTSSPNFSRQFFWERADEAMLPGYSLFNKTQLDWMIEVSPLKSAVEIIPFIQDKDGYWFQGVKPIALKSGKMELSFPLLKESGFWKPVGHLSAWQDHHKLYMKRLGFVVYHINGTAPAVIKVNKPNLSIDRRPQNLEIYDWSLPQTTQKFERINSQFKIKRSFMNPFNPDEIKVDIEVRLPNGEEETWPCFFTQDIDLKVSGKMEKRFRKGESYWEFRYAPKQVGKHEVRIKMTHHDHMKKKEIGVSIWQQFEVLESSLPGFVRVSEKDPRYFEFEGNQEIFFPLGFNLNTITDLRSEVKLGTRKRMDRGSYDYEIYFKEMQANGINTCEVWMAAWSVAIEWNYGRKGYFGLGRYNLESAGTLDRILELAEKYGIYIHLVLDNHGKLTAKTDPEWQESPFYSKAPYAKVNQGFLFQPDDFFTNTQAKVYNRNRNRYINARWGAHTIVWGIEFWSEINLIDNFNSIYNNGSVIKWHQEVRNEARAWNQGGHLYTTHFCNEVDTNIQFKKLQEISEIDYVVGDAYRHGKIPIHDQMQKHKTRLAFYEKPVQITEYGGSPYGNSNQRIVADIHNGLWSTWFTEQAATPLLWWHLFIQEENEYYHYKHFAEWSKDIDPRGKNYQSRILKKLKGSSYNYEGFYMGNETEHFLWLCEKGSLFDFPTKDKIKSTEKKVYTIPLTELNGTFDVEFFNPLTGEKEVHKSLKLNGTLTLPAFFPDIAVKLKKEGS